jgi:predicted O-methyltransferase YrrM
MRFLLLTLLLCALRFAPILSDSVLHRAATYEEIEAKFDALDAWTREEHSQFTDRQWGIASMRLYGMKKTRFVYDYLTKAALHRPVVCELGFMAGHSALLFLETLPGGLVYSFDLGDFGWAVRNAAHLTAAYPTRFEYIMGDSAVTVPEFLKRGVTCDVILVDGSKEAQHRRSDMLLFKSMSQPHAIVFLDEVNTEACLRHFTSGTCNTEASNAGEITKMYGQLIKEGVFEIVACTDTPTPDDSFCVARF